MPKLCFYANLVKHEHVWTKRPAALSLSLTEPPCINVFSASFPFRGPYLYCINRPKCAGVHDAMSLRCPPASPYGTTSTGIISAARRRREPRPGRRFPPISPNIYGSRCIASVCCLLLHSESSLLLSLCPPSLFHFLRLIEVL